MLSDENIQRYVKAMYPVALLLIMVPLVDLSLRGFPPQFGSLQWRFGIVGLVLGNFGTVLLGTGLLGFVAALSGHRTVLRVLGYVALVLSVVTLAVVALFVLDAVQMRQLANATIKRTVLASSAGALFTGLLGGFTLFTLGRGALAASRGGVTSGRRVRPVAPQPLVAARGSGSDTI